eukprot:3352864-Amphidinium_carterae.2
MKEFCGNSSPNPQHEDLGMGRWFVVCNDGCNPHNEARFHHHKTWKSAMTMSSASSTLAADPAIAFAVLKEKRTSQNVRDCSCEPCTAMSQHS